MNNNELDFFARAALGIGIGAMLAVLVSTMNRAFAATVGLADADTVAVKVMLVSIVIWFLCRWIQVRR